LRARGSGGEAEVISLQRLDRREACRPGQHLARARPPGIALGTERLLQEIGVGDVFPLRRRLRNRAVQPRQRGKPKLLAQLLDALVLKLAHAAPPA
jgi:hypothetical protein